MKATDMDFVLACQKWVENFVIAHDLCPFASSPFKAGRIRFELLDGGNSEELLKEIENELNLLLAQDVKKLSNTLLIIRDDLSDFYDYLEFYAVVENLLDQLDYSDQIQLASFHPDYQFAGTTPDDPTNRTNQSPYPMIHLLRVDEVSDAIDSIGGKTQMIIDRNLQLMRDLHAQES